jgi:glycosyltransferase involved in cell wall biosynthesis
VSERPPARQGGRIRVVHVLDNLNTGGTELNAVRTAERLDRDRFDVRFLCLQAHGPLRARLDAAGIPVREIPVAGLMSASGLRRGLEIRSLVRQEQIDVVHAHDPYANVLAAPWVRLAGRGAVIASHRWWRNVHPSRVRLANRFAYRFAHRVLANSASVGELVVREEGVPRSRLVVVPNFVDESAFAPLPADRRAALRKRVGLGEGDVAVGMVANLYAVKNQAMLLRCAARLIESWPDLRFVLVGEGREREALAALASDLGVAHRVLMPGHVPHEPGFAGIFDIAVLTSREEGFPNWVVEAMAAGRPVVATNVGGIPDAVVEGETGYLVASEDDASMSTAVDTLLRDPRHQTRMGAAGTVRARALYHVETVIELLQNLYTTLATESVR